MSAKICVTCKVEKPLEDFYRTARQVLSSCKVCHNARCMRRRAESPALRVVQYRAKRRWTLANPIRKRIHEGRSIVLHKAAPAPLRALELALMQLTGEFQPEGAQ